LNVSTFDPFGSSGSFLATAANAAPVDTPTKIPSSFAIRFAKSNDSSFPTVMIPSNAPVFQIDGTNPAPKPCNGCGDGLPPLNTGDNSGSTANTFNEGNFCFTTSAMAVM
jgi:hypothetical protein